MKVITRVVSIQNKEFVLVQMEEKDLSEKSKSLIGSYGTIDYELLDEKGCLKRQLNGLEMGLCDTIARAIDYRNDEINLSKYDDLDDKERMIKIKEYFERKLRLQGAR